MENKKWYDKTWFVVLLIILIFPIGLYALWMNKTINKGWKIGITILFGLIVASQFGKNSDAISEDVEVSENLVKDNGDDEINRQQEISDSIQQVRERTRDSLVNSISGNKRLRVVKDEFKPDYEFYYPVNAPKYTNVNWIYPYLGRTDDQVWMRFKIQYKADSWLFINKVSALVENANDEKEVIELYSGTGFERDNSGGEIWEYIDLEVNDLLYLKLLKLNSAKSVKIRYDGSQYYNDRNLTANEKRALSDIIEIYKEVRQ